MENRLESKAFTYLIRNLKFFEFMIALMITSGIMVLNITPCIYIRKTLTDFSIDLSYIFITIGIFLFSTVIVLERIVITVLSIILKYIIIPLLVKFSVSLSNNLRLNECFDRKHDGENNLIEKIYYSENWTENDTFIHKDTLSLLAQKEIITNEKSYPYFNDWAKKRIEKRFKKKVNTK